MAMTAAPEVGGPGFAACPACIAAPAARALAGRARGGGDASAGRLLLSVPGAHCAACIVTIEGALAAVPGVRAVRLNLTQRRARIDAAPEVGAADLVAALARAGYEAQELDEAALGAAAGDDPVGRDLLMRLAVAFFAMMNVMLLSVAVWSGADGPTRDVFHWISAAIALPTVAFSGQPFFRAAWAGLRAGRVVMDFPISLALVLASAISIYETMESGAHAYFDAAVMLCFFLLIGRYLDHRTRALARSAAQELAALEVPRATVLVDGAEVLRPIAEVRAGDRVLVRPGERLPVDGVVEEGASEVDRSLLTGESLPATADPGTELAAGEVNLTGPLILRVTSSGRDTSLARIAELVAVAEAARTRHKSLAERASRVYSPLVHTLAFSAFSWWLWASGGDIRLALNIAAAVLIITCPCALGLAVPAVVTAASGQLFRRGVLIKHGTALERLAEVDTVVFDKTGTLTMGTPEATNLDKHPPQALALALALAQGSAHPLARALAQAVQARGITPEQVDGVREIPGFGIEGRWQNLRVRLGRAEWCGARDMAETATHLAIGEGAGAQVHGFTFADRMRPGAARAVAELLRSGIRVLIISGDAAPVVAAMAARLGIREWQAGALPEEKAARIEALAAEGARVLMVGDGLNDTAALAGAHVSISPASALDAARVASDIVLLGASLAPIADALRIGRQARRRILQNFGISGGYNIIAVPLALAGHATPLAAALAMSLSSITVSLNAIRLR